MNKFTPLMQSERETAPSFQEKGTGELISPVPENVPKAPTSHTKLGQPSKVWAYKDASGKVLFYVCRFNLEGGKKQILPLSLWLDDAGLEWRWKGVPAPRPLYGLDRLAASPESPVVIVEGEKTCDAAGLIFPQSVCVTSCGGSQAVSKTDWTVLRGRKRALIVPDNDAAGLIYAKDVAAIVASYGVAVSIVDIASVKMSNGESLPDKWDVADAVNWPANDLRKVLAGAARPFKSPPSYISWGEFSMSGDGLKLQVTKGRGENQTVEEVQICGALEVLGRSRNPAGHSWGLWARWSDPDRRVHTLQINAAELQGEPAGLCAKLADMGLHINRARQRDFVTYLTGCKTNGRVTLVSRTGWHDIGGNSVFVLPDETFGPLGAENVILDGSAAGPYERKGTLQHWKDTIAKPAGEHLLCVLALSTALAGPLLHLAGQEGGGVHFWGTSSKGKTTLLQILATVWGKGSSSGGYVRSWRATGNALEGVAASATDTALVLDELGQVEGRDAGAAIYGLSNGAGKTRAARDGALRDAKTWRALTISSGEIPVESKLSEDKSKRPRAGQMVRMLDVPIDRTFGVFDHNGGGDAAALAKVFKYEAIHHYGHAGPEFVREIISNGVAEIGDNVRQAVAAFIQKYVPAGSDGQIDRAAQRLGLVAAAGELAIIFGLLPWQSGLARDASAWALCKWIEGRGGVEPMENRQAIEQVRGFIERHGDSRFDNIDIQGASPVNNRLGWMRSRDTAREWLIPSEIWKSEVCNGINATEVAKTLFEQGMLRRGNDGYSSVWKIAGRAQRGFNLTSRILEGASHEG